MATPEDQIIIRECTTINELASCVELQREVFALPDIEISPVRHLVVTKSAGGFTLGAFVNGNLAGFVLSVPAYLRETRAYYSHMTAVRAGFQSLGIGARLKWAQRERSLAEGIRYIKWTFEPLKARNAYFNLEKLGAVVREYAEDYYGVDYDTVSQTAGGVGLASDRLFAEWDLESDKVKALAAGRPFANAKKPAASIAIPANWQGFALNDAKIVLKEQLRVRSEFQAAFSRGLICSGFERSETQPRFLLFES